MKSYRLADLQAQYAIPDKSRAEALLHAEILKDHHKIVVLDDDPTGVQTVHGVCVFTDWTVQSLRAGFEAPEKLFYILTNSRSFTEERTAEVHKQIAENLALVAKETGKAFFLISRGDSTLRGHYPLENEILKNALEKSDAVSYDGEILCPFFKDGGRFTADDIHYVLDKDDLIPAAETEFAKDKTFGYTSSHLGAWIEEKTNGKYRKEAVTYITLEMLRLADLDAIEQKLLGVCGFNKVVVNALDDSDLQIFCTAFYRVADRKRFLFRTAASFVKALAGIKDRPLLRYSDLIQKEDAGHGGLIVAGSHTKKTTAQLEQLKDCLQVVFVEFNQHLLADGDEAFEKEIKRVTERCAEEMQNNHTVCVSTRRERFDLNTGNKEDELVAATKISGALTSIVFGLRVRPSFVLAKGGITSSDTGTKGLGVQRAVVAGQIQPGIPVWICGDESRFPGMPYIIFPGNVGESSALKNIVELLTMPSKEGSL